jgi:hypothetical protein
MVPVPMSATAPGSLAESPPLRLGERLRVAFLGSATWLGGCAPTQAAHGLRAEHFVLNENAHLERELASIGVFRPHATVIFDPVSIPLPRKLSATGATLGLLVDGVGEGGGMERLDGLDRLATFTPSLTRIRVGRHEVWRAIPWPVSDALFRAPRTRQRPPRAMSIGRSTAFRESMLMPAKHHHDLLQVIHGLVGEALRDVLDEHDVGVYVAPETGAGFGLQVGMHLAAGHLLLAADLSPAHGLERNIDYLHVDSPDGLVWVLDRMTRFPDMYTSVRVRGHIKAEQYRASRLFGRLVHDLLADVATFGPGR